MQLQAQIAEGDISKVREGMKADFTVSAYAEGNVHFSGTLSEVRLIPANELGAVFYRVVIDVANQKDGTGAWKLRPGMTASVDIIRRKHDHAWKVPTSALNFQPDEQHLTDAARAKLAAWGRRTDRELWKPVWVLNEQKKPWPVFVRVGGTNKEGDEGIRDGQYTEVLEWDPELRPAPDPANEATYPKVINGTKAPPKGGLFSNMPNIKF
jgi:HlyD family secretion protein